MKMRIFFYQKRSYLHIWAPGQGHLGIRVRSGQGHWAQSPQQNTGQQQGQGRG
jgi:hypothetical protein